MKEDTPETFSITSIEFIFRRPWIFISSVVIIMSLVHAKVSLDPVEYESSAVLSFEMAGEAAASRTAERKIISIKKNLVSKALLGTSIRGIIKEVWPKVGEKDDPIGYNRLLDKLRSSDEGIQIGDDKKTPPNLLEISYRNPDPEICYKVVNVTIEAIKRENKKAIEEKIESKLDFLRNQIKFYKNKLNAINKEMVKIKDELIEKFPELTEREKDLIASIGVGRESGIIKQGSLETYVMYDEMLAKLDLELLEAQKKKENLQKYMETGTVAPRRRSSAHPDEDIFVGEYSKAAAAKELQIADLIARGYTKDHPEIRKIQNETNRLADLTRERISTLRDKGPELFGEDVAKEKMVIDIEEIDFEIESIKSKINLIGEYRKLSKEQLKPAEGGKSNVIYEKVERLRELENEKEINERYYLDIRKQLEEAQLKARLEKEDAGFKIDIIEEPLVPFRPVTMQKTKLMILGFIISLMVGAGLAYFIDSLDNSIRSGKELRELLNVPVLASIDIMSSKQEIMAKRIRRNTILISLFIFVIVSKILVKLLTAIF